jgi:RNA polymerase sigma-70 factor (ECF subfamily)
MTTADRGLRVSIAHSSGKSHVPLGTTDTLDSFLAGVARRAFRMACVSTGDRDAALDIVQDAMLRLVRSYRDRPADEWPPLFFRILGNTITDWHRRQQQGARIFDRWFGSHLADDGDDALDSLPLPANQQPEQQLEVAQDMLALETAINGLSLRQQQAFMLRCWQGLSTTETAQVMGCTEGTVKTLYSRALHSLRATLTTGLQT